MKSPKKLNKLKLAFITGATKGIGRSTAITFANAGWDLILLARNMESMERLKSELLTTKSKISLVKCDLSNSLEIDNCVEEAIEKHLNSLLQMNKDELIEERYKKFRVLGKFIEANNIEEIYSEIPQKTE